MSVCLRRADLTVFPVVSSALNLTYAREKWGDRDYDNATAEEAPRGNDRGRATKGTRDRRNASRTSV